MAGEVSKSPFSLLPRSRPSLRGSTFKVPCEDQPGGGAPPGGGSWKWLTKGISGTAQHRGWTVSFKRHQGQCHLRAGLRFGESL